MACRANEEGLRLGFRSCNVIRSTHLTIFFYIQIFMTNVINCCTDNISLKYAYQKDAKVTWLIVLCLDISSMVTIAIPSSHHACVVGPRPCSTCIPDYNIGMVAYQVAYLGWLLWNAVLRRNCTCPPSFCFKIFNYFSLVAGLLPFLWRHIRAVFIEDFLFIRNYVATLITICTLTQTSS